jgi:hypothetical protein
MQRGIGAPPGSLHQWACLLQQNGNSAASAAPPCCLRSPLPALVLTALLQLLPLLPPLPL